MSTFKIEFRGKTQDDVRHQFLKWHQESAGLVFNVTGHPIEELPVVLRFPRGAHQRTEHVDRFSMLVEYEVRSDAPPRRPLTGPDG